MKRKYTNSDHTPQASLLRNLQRRASWLLRHNLRPRRVHDPRRAPVGRDSGFQAWLDHVEIFGTTGSKRPVFTTQPYCFYASEIERFCRAHDYVVFAAEPAESWHLPNRTHLLIAVPAELSGVYVMRETAGAA